MRSKDQIIGIYEDEVSYHPGGSDANQAIQGRIFLEVLLDIRDNLDRDIEERIKTRKQIDKLASLVITGFEILQSKGT